MNREKLSSALNEMIGKSFEYEFTYPDEKKASSGMSIMTILVVGTIAEVFRAFAFATLWNWFMVPIFGLPRLTTLLAMGILLPVFLIISKPNEGSDHPIENFLAIMVGAMLALLFGLAIKWLAGL